MARFLIDNDYAVQIRTEIAKVIDNTPGNTKLLAAEQMAIAQIRNHISGRYDCDKIFTPISGSNPDTRDQFIVMIVIDIALYHIWSKEAPNNIPKNRELRYNDALEWLKAVQKGQSADLPALTDATTNEEINSVRIWSKYTPDDNRF